MSMLKSKFHQSQPRVEATVICRCFAKPALFKKWEDMTEAAKQEFKTNGPIPCEGGGLPGEWCAGCRFGSLSNPEIVEK